ncbi:glycine betaine ABC transporter substrate-binding protein [Paludibaculum fermentans]|uniref:ABC transporter substrate-binding protein n=1 Tax=Paludibaculum fermentans TaxID=1473598 RepID=UPI003EBBD27D
MIGFRLKASLCVVWVGCVLAAGCRRPHPTLTVGSKDGAEQLILGEILAQHLSRSLPSVQIARKFGLGNVSLVHSSLLTGEINIYPEYSGTALFNVLNMQPDRGDDALLDQVREGYRTTFHCEWFGPLGFRYNRVFLVPRHIAEKRKVQNLTQVSDSAEGWAIGSSREFRDRPDGMVRLTRKYELQLSVPVQIITDEPLFTAMSKDQITLGITRTTDPRIGTGDLVEMPDDQMVYPIYEAGYVVKLETLEAYPGLANSIKALYGKITLDRMRAMVRRVELERADVASVAAGFLKEVGLN